MLKRDPKELDSITQSVAKSFVATFHHQEAPYFSIIWDALAQRRGATGHSETIPKHLNPSEIGLPFDGEEFVKLVTPTVILVVAGAVETVRARDASPTLAEIQAALRSGARKFGETSEFADKIADVIGSELYARLKDAKAEWSARTSTQPEVPVDQARLTVSWLKTNGDYQRPDRFSKEKAQQLSLAEDYDILVDERTHLLTIGDADPKLIKPIRRMQRGMLWLVLTHVGDYFSHDQINLVFGRVNQISKRAERNPIYQYPAELRKLVGDLYDDMLEEGTNHVYEVKKRGWSFCWILPSRNITDSDLYPEPKEKASEAQ